jgi:hypothetical protein
MKALSIAASLCLFSTAALAQSANKPATSLDTCFKLVSVTEANCSPSANDAERQACLQDARKMQRVCLELAGSQPSAPAEATVAVATSPPTRPAQGTNWTVSEMSSPVDYSPVVTATIRARSENRISPAALVVRCRGGRGELGLRMEGIPRPSRGGEILVTQQINDQPSVKSRWIPSADGKTANYRDDATALLQSFSDDTRLKIVLSDGPGRDSEAAFQFAGWNAVREKIAAACMWTSTSSKSSERR